MSEAFNGDLYYEKFKNVSTEQAVIVSNFWQQISINYGKYLWNIKEQPQWAATGGKAAGDRLQSLSTQLLSLCLAVRHVPFATQSDYRRKKDN